IEVVVEGSNVQVIKIVSVVDCGRVLDRGIATSNIEGGSIFGLSYCKAQVTFKSGRVEQDNFNTYEMPYLAEAPEMVTEFIESNAALGGVGEVSPVTVPPALLNAIYRASGRRLRSLPLALHGMQFALRGVRSQ
ncbi:MAG TPA: molybdopterin cofactor-binding domain-containing protein, partial [Steroidobacteraceae bacterium]